MDSESDLSILSPSNADSTETGSRKGRPTHPIWSHTRPARDGENPNLKYCRHCSESKIYSTKVTTNMRNHLKSKHGIVVEATLSVIREDATKQLEQLYQRAAASGETDQIDTQVLRKVLNQDAIDEGLVLLIAVCNLLFRFVERVQFHT